MTEQAHYVLGPDVADGEELRDRRGQLIDDGYADQAADDALRRVKGRGRPSLSHSGESPLLRVRLPEDLNDAVSEAARGAGTSRSEWVRQALAEATRKAS
jgi:predicted transcriptional regulator